MKNDNTDKVNEPAAEYNAADKRITFFKSFEEEQEAQIIHWRSLSPEQRMEHLRIISLYTFSAFEKYKGNRLIFD